MHNEITFPCDRCGGEFECPPNSYQLKQYWIEQTGEKDLTVRAVDLCDDCADHVEATLVEVMDGEW